MHDLIFIGMELWDEVWRRSQNLMACYARRFPECKVLFVALPLDVSYSLRTAKRRAQKAADRTAPGSVTPLPELGEGPGVRAILREALRPARPQKVAGFDNLFVLRPVKWFPDSLETARTWNQAVARAQVRRAARSLGMARPLLWIKPPSGAHYVGQMDDCAVLYDVGDDWTTITQSAKAKQWAIEGDEFLTRHADAILVVSDDLYTKKRAMRETVTLVPNGVDAERYAAVCKRVLPSHAKTSGWTRPVLGYTGMLHADRFDIALTRAVARQFPQGTVALVGPNLLPGEKLEQLLSEPNIRVTGPVPHHELPNVMTAFDVCIVPNLVNAFSESQNPLKLWEYLASGLPTVATPVSGFRDFPELVYLAANADAFTASIRSALAEPPERAAKRQQAVAGQTWDARLDTILDVLRALPMCATTAAPAVVRPVK